MKKILLFSLLIAIAAASCKKYNNPSITVTASYPTIIFVNGNLPYFTVPLGGTLPKGSAVATAYDSFYQTSLSVVVYDSMVNTFKTGLYTAAATAKNKYGYLTSLTYYVAVTNLPDANLKLSGKWKMGISDSFDNFITPVITDYYQMSNYAGAYPDSTGGSAIFAVIDDSDIAVTDGTPGTLHLATGDTTITYSGLTFTKFQ